MSLPLRTVLLLVSVGGALGSLARYAVALAIPHAAGQLPWSTLVANVSGALLIGVLMGLMATVWAHTHRLRPFLGVGVLGGYTTFSTAMLDTRTLLTDAPLLALVYVALTLLLGLAAVVVGLAVGQPVGARLEHRLHRRRAEQRAAARAAQEVRP